MNPAAAFLIAFGIWLILTEGILPNLDDSKEEDTFQTNQQTPRETLLHH